MNDIMIALQAAEARANMTMRPMAVMKDLSVQEVTDYTKANSVEIVHPRLSHVHSGNVRSKYRDF